MAASIYDWSLVAANNSNADADMTWAEGQAPSTVNNSARVILQRGRQLLVDIGGSLAAGGTANGLTVTASSPFTAYADGMVVSFRAPLSNTTAATLSVNGIAAKAIRKMDSTGDVAIVANEIRATGIYVVQYSAALNGAAGAWLLVNPTLSAALYAFAALVTVDNTVPRFDGVIGKLQTSGVVIDDSNGLTATTLLGVTSVASDTGGIGIFGNTTNGGSLRWRPNGVGSATNQASYSTGGNLTITGDYVGVGGTFSGPVTGTTGTFTGIVRAANGTAAAPGYRFTGLAGTGLFFNADNGIGFGVSGNDVSNLHSTGFTVGVGLGPALVNPAGPSAGISLSYVGAYASYMTAVGTLMQVGSAQGTFNAMNFIRVATSVGTISCSAGATAYNTSSDMRRKENWRPFDSGAIIDAIDMFEFDWKDGEGAIGYGVLAQRARAAFPNAITVGADGFLMADYSKYVPVMWNEIKQLRQKIAAAGL